MLKPNLRYMLCYFSCSILLSSVDPNKCTGRICFYYQAHSTRNVSIYMRRFLFGQVYDKSTGHVKQCLKCHVSYPIQSILKEARSVTMNIFRFFFYFLLNIFVKIELSYVFTINMFITAENCIAK